MDVNTDFTRRAATQIADIEWISSPVEGIDRKMLERDGGEVARATTVVRFAPGAKFPFHEHVQGEEFFVLEGTFSDASGDYKAGSYLRNPAGTSHSPWSDEGCLILVKLRQFAEDDKAQKAIDTNVGDWQATGLDGLDVMPLHEHGSESVNLYRLAPGVTVPEHTHEEGEEFMVLEGTLTDENGHYPKGTWVRQPAGSHHTPYSDGGCLLYVKTGHL